MQKFVQNDNNLAITYYRYSSASQNEASIDQQRKEAHKYAEEKGFKIIREYEDAAISGTTNKRPGFNRMLSEVSSLKPAALILWKTDRLSRDQYDIAFAKKKIKEAGCKIHLIAESIPDSPEAILIEGLLDGMAAYYSLQLSSNVMRGLHDNAEKGLYNGVKITGYTVDGNKKYAIDPLTAPVVKQIFDLYASGHSMARICEMLNQKGLRTVNGNLYTINSLRAILRNRAYIGEYKYAGYVIPNAIPPIVTEEVFERVQQKFIHNKRFGAQKPRGMEDDAPRFWLTGKLFCAQCGSTMNGISGTSKTGARHYYYSCNGHYKGKRGNGCEKKPVRKKVLEDMVSYLINRDVLNSGELQFELAERIALSLTEQAESNEYVINTIKAELAQNNKAIDNIMRAIIGGASGDTINKKLAELEENKKALEDALSIEEAKKDMVCNKDDILKFLNKYLHANMDDPILRDEILEHYVERIIVDDYEIEIHLKYPYITDEATLDRIYSDPSYRPWHPVVVLQLPEEVMDELQKERKKKQNTSQSKISSFPCYSSPP